MACDKVDDVFLSELEGGSVTVELLLGMEWVHGDLSPYNMLYHDGRIVLIDFPQVADINNNPRARRLLERDIERISQMLAELGKGPNHSSL